MIFSLLLCLCAHVHACYQIASFFNMTIEVGLLYAYSKTYCTCLLVYSNSFTFLTVVGALQSRGGKMGNWWVHVSWPCAIKGTCTWTYTDVCTDRHPSQLRSCNCIHPCCYWYIKFQSDLVYMYICDLFRKFYVSTARPVNEIIILTVNAILWKWHALDCLVLETGLTGSWRPRVLPI